MADNGLTTSGTNRYGLLAVLTGMGMLGRACAYHCKSPEPPRKTEPSKVKRIRPIQGSAVHQDILEAKQQALQQTPRKMCLHGAQSISELGPLSRSLKEGPNVQTSLGLISVRQCVWASLTQR